MSKIKKVTMQDVKKIVFACLLILFIGACVSCKAQVKEKKEIYTIHKHQSIEKGSNYLNLSFYHYENKVQAIPAVFTINGIIYGPKEDLGNYIIPVRPGKYKIRAGYVNKKWTKINIIVEETDSVEIQIYLKDDPKPLH